MELLMVLCRAVWALAKTVDEKICTPNSAEKNYLFHEFSQFK